MHDSFETYLPWFTLREIPFLGNTLCKKLIHHFQTPENILNASEAQLKQIQPLSARIIKNILYHNISIDNARRELERVLNNNIKIVTLTDASYPALLKQIPDPPLFLTYLGTLNTTAPCISVIGSRKATSYGLSTAENLSCRLAGKGFQIVSGLARGIDTMAHKGALRAKGQTIAVLGSGLNIIYPRENRMLFQKISETGTIFSEFKTNTDPLPKHFPIRNRIIAGLSCGSVVVEAAKRSGSLITARLSSEYNREVFAVPGSIKSKKSEGTHSLLKQGARLVENEMDIIDELYQFIHEKKPAPSLQSRKISPYIESKPKDRTVYHLLDPYPVHIDVIIEKSGMTCSQVTSQLLDLELQGKVIRHQGNFYSISEEYH